MSKTTNMTAALGNMIAQAMAAQGPQTDWTKMDTQIKHEGQQIILPESPTPMALRDAIETLERLDEQENQQFDVSELVLGAPWDTLVAVYKAMQDIYGVVMSQSIKSFFGEIKPDFVTVTTGHGEHDRVQVPAGLMKLPGVEDDVYVSMTPHGTRIYGTVRRRDRAILVEIANKAREIIRTDSVYKSKSIRLNVDEEGNLDLNVQPEFLDLSAVREDHMIHTDETAAMIATNIMAPLKNTVACRQNKIPLKRGILLEGKYGTGKSLTSRVTAKVANDNGWTFIMLNRSQGLKAAIEFARQYQPCVIFAEDIDRAADREDEDVNDLVNLLDGLITKDMEMMVVLTTNYIENIDKALLRPGRFDAIISIDAPDAATAERIIRSYAGDLLGADESLERVGMATSGMIPASIREVVERAKLSMLTEGRTKLSPEDLYISATGMKRHMKLLEPKPAERSAAERFASSFTELIIGAVGDDTQAYDMLLGKVDSLAIRHREGVRALMGKASDVERYAASAASNSEHARRNAKSAYDKADEVLEAVKEN